MSRLKEIWGTLLPAERLVIAVAVLAMLVTAGVAVITQLDRPGDVSDEDVPFAAPERKATKGGKKGPGRTAVGWRFYGYDAARTKSVDRPALRPPFRQVWKYHRGELLEFAPVAAKGRIFGIDNDGVFFALRAGKGTEVWKRKLAELNASAPAYLKGTLYAVTLVPGQALAVDAKTGKVKWRRPLESRAESSPLVIGKRMYFGTEAGNVYALNARNGKVIWKTSVAGEVKAAPALSGGNLYVGDYAGKMYSIRAANGAIRWQTSDLGVGFGRSGRFYSTPAVAFGRVYAGNVDGRVYSFSADDGRIAWTKSVGAFVYSGIAAADTGLTEPAVYFGSHNRNAYSLDAKTGEVIWEANAGGQVSGPMTVIGPVAYVSTFNGNKTSGFNLRSGRKVFKIDEGEYGPVITNGHLVFLIGDDTITALRPVKKEQRNKKKGLKERPGTKGIVGSAPRRTGRIGLTERHKNRKVGKKAQRKRSKPKRPGQRNRSGKRR